MAHLIRPSLNQLCKHISGILGLSFDNILPKLCRHGLACLKLLRPIFLDNGAVALVIWPFGSTTYNYNSLFQTPMLAEKLCLSPWSSIQFSRLYAVYIADQKWIDHSANQKGPRERMPAVKFPQSFTKELSRPYGALRKDRMQKIIRNRLTSDPSCCHRRWKKTKNEINTVLWPVIILRSHRSVSSSNTNTEICLTARAYKDRIPDCSLLFKQIVQPH